MNDIGPDETGRILLEVQQLDTEMLELKREIEGLEEKHRLAELLEELGRSGDSQAGKEEELEELEHRQHKIDGELDLLSTKVKKEEGKLFSGTIMNPKELSNIQAEILSLRKKRDEMETEDLELMEGIDRMRLEVKGAKEASREAYSREQGARDAYNMELAEGEARLKDLERERDELLKSLDEDVRGQYERLLKEKGGLAVVRIDQGRNCGGCHIEFSRTQIDRFQHEEGIFRCEYCRRILVK